MSTLPQISGAELVKAMKRDGWDKVSQRGSHVKMCKHLPGTIVKKTVIVPMHKELKKGTLSGILKDAGLPVEQFKELL